MTISDFAIAAYFNVTKVGDFVYANQQCGAEVCPVATAWLQPVYSCDVTNNGPAGTRVVTFLFHAVQPNVYGGPPSVQDFTESFSLGLNSGETYHYRFDNNRPGPGGYIKVAFGRGTTVTMHLEDDAGGSTIPCIVSV